MPSSWLNVPHFRQEHDYSCVAACVRMVLAHYGDLRTTKLSSGRRPNELEVLETNKAAAAAELGRSASEALVWVLASNSP